MRKDLSETGLEFVESLPVKTEYVIEAQSQSKAGGLHSKPALRVGRHRQREQLGYPAVGLDTNQ